MSSVHHKTLTIGMEQHLSNNQQPEVELLQMAALGLDPNLSPTNNDYQYIATKLAERKIVLLFKWFWRHDEVLNFANKFIPHIDPDSIAAYLRNLSQIMANRSSVHWLERINLFHVYGLSRLFDSKTGLKILENDFGYTSSNKQIVSLSDISAFNVSLMLKDAVIADCLKLFDHISNNRLISLFGQYQIYYYGGFYNLFEILKDYKNSSKEVIIPQTVAGLFLTEPSSFLMTKMAREKIYDELISDMPASVINKLERFDKKYGLSFKT